MVFKACWDSGQSLAGEDSRILQGIEGRRDGQNHGRPANRPTGSAISARALGSTSQLSSNTQPQAQHQASLALTRGTRSTELTGSPPPTCVANASKKHYSRSRHALQTTSRLQLALACELAIGTSTMTEILPHTHPINNRLFDNVLLYFFIVPAA